MPAPLLRGDRSTDEVGDVGRRTPPDQGLPVDDDRPGVAGLKQEIVEAEVAVTGGPRSGSQRDVRGHVGRQEAAELLVLGRHGVGVALEEAGEQHLHHGGQEFVGIGRATVEPVQRGQLRRLPTRSVESRHFVENGRGDVRTAGRHLVALGAADDVLEQEGEPPGLGFDLGDIGGRDAGVDPGCHLTVEADLDLVGPEGETGAPALVVGRGELAHHGGRAGRAGVAGIGEGETGRVGHLAGADGFAGEALDAGARLGGAGLDQRLGQPLRRHVGRGAQQGNRAHGGTRLGAAGPVRLRPHAVAAAVGRLGGWRSARLPVPHRARPRAQTA